MQHILEWKSEVKKFGNLFINSLALLLTLPFLLGVFTKFVDAAPNNKKIVELPKMESPKKVILVKDYKWLSGGMGRVGILKEVTLENKGRMTYKNIEIEAEFFTANDTPLGSLRSTIHEELPSGGEKTFYNVNFGIMHSELQKTAIKVVGAELVETGPPSLPRDLILVKNWEWIGGQYGTEGILKEITLENNSTTNYKDIAIKVENLGVGGLKHTSQGYTTVAVIHDVLPAKSTKTFKNINVGFKHPDTKESLITVVDATPITAKELKYRLAKEGGTKKKKVAKKDKKIDTKTAKRKTEVPEETSTEETTKLTLAEKYKKKVLEESKEKETAEISPKKEETPIIETPSEEGAKEEVEEAFPKADIVVRDFKLKSGITGTMGEFEEITLENKSGIAYRNIELIVEFYSLSDRRPLGSYNITIYDVLPPNSKRVFRDVRIGFLSFIPQDIKVRVLNATVVR